MIIGRHVYNIYSVACATWESRQNPRDLSCSRPMTVHASHPHRSSWDLALLPHISYNISHRRLPQPDVMDILGDLYYSERAF